MARVISKTVTNHEWEETIRTRDKYGEIVRYRCTVCGLTGSEYQRNMITVSGNDSQGKTLRDILKCKSDG